MKKKLFACIIIVIMIASLVACANDRTGGEITLVNNNVEIHGALSEFAELYYERTGVLVNVQSFGGETPYAAELSAMFAAGQEPEIFVFDGIVDYNDARNAGRVFDFTGQPWLADTDLAYISPTDGTPVGFPVSIEGWGLAYNRRILEEAGVDTSTMTNINGIRAALEAVEAQKDELGLDAVVTITAGAHMTWVTGFHGVNAYLSLGLEYDDTSIIDMLNAGHVDTARLTAFAEYYHMLFQFADQAMATTGSYDESIYQFATEKSAFIHQGNWIDSVFADMDVDFEMGYVPHAFLTHDTPGIFVGAPSWYMVNALAENTEAALDFLNFLASSSEGHHYMAIASGQVPAFRSVELLPKGSLSAALMEWSRQGQIYAWHQNEMPDGFGMGTIGPIFTAMALGEIGVEEFVEMFTAAVATLG